MSGQTTPRGRPSKTMSSRLMAMKFMQRAAASAPSIPESHVYIADTLASKYQNRSTDPSCTATSPDQEQIQVTLAEEEGEGEKSDNTIESLAKEAPDLDWALSVENGDEGKDRGGLRVYKAGYADIDREAWVSAVVGRRSFGKFNQDVEKRQDGGTDDHLPSSVRDIEASRDQDSDKDNAPTDTESLHRAPRHEAFSCVHDERQQRKKQQAEPARRAEKRRNKKVSLDSLSSISGVGIRGNKLGSSSKAEVECYSCGEKGHTKRYCPRKGKRKNEDWHCGAAKRPKTPLES